MIWKCTIPDYDLISPNRFMRMHFRTRMAEHKKLLELMMFGVKRLVLVKKDGHQKRLQDIIILT